MAFVPLSFGDDPDPDEFIQALFDDFAGRVEGWVPLDGDPVTAFLQEVGRYVHELRVLARDVGAAIFVQAGRTLFGVGSDVATPATLTADVTFSDTNGHTIPAGTQAAYTDPLSGQVYTYATTAQVTIAEGEDTAEVNLQAILPGSDFNVVTSGESLALTDILAGATGVVATSDATGGVDDEAPGDYVDSLAEQLRTLHMAVSNEHDAAILARNVDGVFRAFAIDGWDPGDGTLDNDMDVGIVFLDTDGAAVSNGVRDAALEYLTSDDLRTVNVNLLPGAPTYTQITVVFTATSDVGFDPAVVEAAAEQALRDYIDPAYWAGGRAQPPTWTGENVVRYLDVAGVINRVPGISSLLTLTVNGGTSNVTLSGKAPLPKAFDAGVSPSSVSGTVTAA